MAAPYCPHLFARNADGSVPNCRTCDPADPRTEPARYATAMAEGRAVYAAAVAAGVHPVAAAVRSAEAAARSLAETDPAATLPPCPDCGHATYPCLTETGPTRRIYRHVATERIGCDLTTTREDA